MMSQRPLVKIIKRDERISGATRVAQHVEEDVACDSTRHITSTVTGWIHEFQNKQHAERKRAFKVLSENRAPLSDVVSKLMPIE